MSCRPFVDVVLPAHAGMIPEDMATINAEYEVLPAHAGLIPQLFRVARRADECSPRMRG